MQEGKSPKEHGGRADQNPTPLSLFPIRFPPFTPKHSRDHGLRAVATAPSTVPAERLTLSTTRRAPGASPEK